MAILFKKNITDSIIAGVWKITETLEDMMSQIKLSLSETDYLYQFKSEERKKHWLASRLLLKELMPGKYEISYNENGKPIIKNELFHISISHSGNYAAAVINKYYPTGIDIEKQRKKIENVADRFLNEKEKSDILKKDYIIEKYHIYWSAKEALYKVSGEKGLSFRESIFVEDFEYKEEGTFNATLNGQKFNLYYTKIEDYFLVMVNG
ncbi:MAG: 4'-phosphopantetheinyl transferase superfamily protein [Bacteroidota bacterium]|nr:4'-phosphopantetheinyl transferase superfamily protein [Bacteroidota bacterium]